MQSSGRKQENFKNKQNAHRLTNTQPTDDSSASFTACSIQKCFAMTMLKIKNLNSTANRFE